MRIIVVTLAGLALGAPAAQSAEPKGVAQHPIRFVQATPDQQCPKPLLHREPGENSAQMKKLNELPPADAFHAVYRLDDKGCVDPVMVGYQHGRRR